MGMEGAAGGGDTHFISALTGTLMVSGTNTPGQGPSADLLNVVSYQSGSVLFVTGTAGAYSGLPRVGINTDTPDHELAVSGNISASVNISASAFYGDGSNLSGVGGAGGLFTALNGTNAYITSSILIGGSTTPSAALVVSGNISSSANLTLAGHVDAMGSGSFQAGLTASSLSINGDSTVTTKISCSNMLSLYGKASSATGMLMLYDDESSFGIFRSGSGAPNALFEVWSAGLRNSISFNATYAGGEQYTQFLLDADSQMAEVSGSLSASVNISASAFYGDGSNLTGIDASNIDAAGSDTQVQFNNNSGRDRVGHFPSRPGGIPRSYSFVIR